MSWSMSYSSSAYEMVRTTLLDCYRWEFSRVVLVQRRGMPPPVWKRKKSRSCVLHRGRRRLERWRRSARSCGMLAACDLVAATAAPVRHMEVEAAASGAEVDVVSGGGGGGRVWRRRRRRRQRRWGMEAEAGSGGGSGGGVVWRRRRGLEIAAAS
jgi:hypothetical protein